MYYTICWKFFYSDISFNYIIINLLITIFISLCIWAYIVKKLIIYKNNQQITKNSYNPAVGGHKINLNCINNNMILYKIYIKYKKPYIYMYNLNNKIHKRYITNLVGISETTRVNLINMINLSRGINTQRVGLNINIYKYYSNNTVKDGYKNNNLKFNEWLAGLIDGDGYLGVSKKGYTSCEITVALADIKALLQIKQKFGGSVKLRTGVQAVRYRLHNKIGMIKLINAINGNIRNSKRLPQLYNVCNILNISIIKPIELNINNSWFSGFFDADGCISFSFKNYKPQLTISVSNKYFINLKPFKDLFNGNIYYDKSCDGYKWCIQSKNDIIRFKQYIYKHPLRTIKFNKITLIKLYYKLISIKAYNPAEGDHNNLYNIKDNNNHILYNKYWNIFIKKWYSK